jgi:hypothetical protein
MEREYLLGVSLLIDQTGIKVVDAPVLPLLIRAETPSGALARFADRVDGQIVGQIEAGATSLRASVDIDQKVYGITIASR